VVNAEASPEKCRESLQIEAKKISGTP